MPAQKQLAVHMLAAAGMVELFGDETSYRVTDAGMAALRAEKEMMEERAKQKEEEEAREKREETKQKAKNKRETLFFWLRALLDLFFLIAGAVIERNTDIVDWFLSLFQ